MAPTRADKTLVDYIAIAICPLLIMVLVGSLVFFCLEVGYAGKYGGNLRWTLFWFVLAMVLVSRIAIEKGSDYASIYGLGLAAATGLMTAKMVTPVFPFWILLGLTWWCCHQLTFDCTLIDEDADASGEGLLDATGLEKPSAPVASPLRKPRSKKAASVWQARWEKWRADRVRRKQRTHAPGLWVVYFSLAALPVFGLGQTLLPAGNIDGRRHAFALLWSYVASALGLLLTTSFLGLRRYLRQSNLQMPPAITATWLGLGSGTAVAILLLAILLPRPDADYSMFRLIDKLGSVAQRASDHALLRGESGEGKGREISREQKKGTSEGPKGSGTEGEPSNESKKDGRETDQPATEKKPSHSSRPDTSAPDAKASPTGEWIATTIRWILRIAVALIVLWLVIRFWRRICKFLGQLWQELQRLWAGLFSGSKAPSKGPTVVSVVPGDRSPLMAGFSNPFLNGTAQRITTAELVRYTFEALQAWAGDRGWPRRSEQTPMEFARQLAESAPPLADEARTVTRFYVSIAYGQQLPADDCTPVLERLWQHLTV